MKKFAIVSNQEERKYFLQIQGPFYLEVSYPGYNYFLDFVEEQSGCKLEVPVHFKTNDYIMPIILSEKTEFEDRALDFINEYTEEYVGKFLASEDVVLDCDNLCYELGKGLTKISEDITKEIFPDYRPEPDYEE